MARVYSQPSGFLLTNVQLLQQMEDEQVLAQPQKIARLCSQPSGLRQVTALSKPLLNQSTPQHRRITAGTKHAIALTKPLLNCREDLQGRCTAASYKNGRRQTIAAALLHRLFRGYKTQSALLCVCVCFFERTFMFAHVCDECVMRDLVFFVSKMCIHLARFVY